MTCFWPQKLASQRTTGTPLGRGQGPASVLVGQMGQGDPSILTATNEPFSPTGTTGQLTIGGVNVTGSANITALVRTDYQGAITLSPSSRTNLVVQSLLPGSGTAPTGWAFYSDTGTSAAATSNYTPGDGAGAWAITSTVGQNFCYQTLPVGANTTYCLSILVESVTGTVTAQNALYCDTFPAGTSIEFPVCTGNPSGGQFGVVQTGVLVVLVHVGSTAGTAEIYFGVGCSASNVGSIKISRPQFEMGTVRTGFIPTVTAAASITDFSYTSAGLVTLGQTSSGTYTWSGLGKTVAAPTNLSCPVPAGLSLLALAASLLLTLTCPVPTTLTLSGQTPALARTIATPAPASLALAPLAPTLQATLASPAPASMSLAGQAPALAGTLAAPTPAGLALQGLVPSLAASTTLVCPAPSSLAMTPLVPSLASTLGAPAPVGMALSGLTLALARTLPSPSSAALALTGQAPVLAWTLMAPAPSALTLTCQAPTLSTSTALICPAPSALSLSGLAPAITPSVQIPATASMALVGTAPAMARTLIAPAPTALAIVGQVPSLARTLQAPTPVSAALVPQVPALTLSLRAPVPPGIALAGIAPVMGKVIQAPSPISLAFTVFSPQVGCRLLAPAPTGLVLVGAVPSITFPGALVTDLRFVVDPPARLFNVDPPARAFLVDPPARGFVLDPLRVFEVDS